MVRYIAWTSGSSWTVGPTSNAGPSRPSRDIISIRATAPSISSPETDTPPLRVFFGTEGLDMIPHVYAERLKTWQDWAHVSTLAQGNPA
ncbi:hypothetical protein ACIBVL_41020 [Streptomyces sp. NPDC049687]|uniref:hypothetical protein n=1 Tax=Streptomyces sp. NPDC049687 TaxID=3365596 RepID=UPI003792FCA8